MLDLHRHMGVWVVQAVTPGARAGMPEQMTRRDLRLKPKYYIYYIILFIDFFGVHIPLVSLSLHLKITRSSESCGSPVRLGRAEDCPDPVIPLPECELCHHLAEDGARDSVVFINLGCCFQRACMACAVFARVLDALRYLKQH